MRGCTKLDSCSADFSLASSLAFLIDPINLSAARVVFDAVETRDDMPDMEGENCAQVISHTRRVLSVPQEHISALAPSTPSPAAVTGLTRTIHTSYAPRAAPGLASGALTGLARQNQHPHHVAAAMRVLLKAWTESNPASKQTHNSGKPGEIQIKHNQ
jgi:hypothetical protein